MNVVVQNLEQKDQVELDYETIEKMCDRDTILTAQEAVDYGLIDKIVTK